MPGGVLGVIPARYQARRFPGKLLADLGGKPVLQHVYEGASACARLDRVLVATDDERIHAEVRAFGGEVTLTSKAHLSGTDRVAEVAQRCVSDVVVNIQGDEPFVNSAVLGQVVGPLLGAGEWPMSTLCKPIQDRRTLEDPNVVKVVKDDAGLALYFSRSPIPNSHREPATSAWEHIGIYAYRREFLLAFSRMPPSSLERAEGLEQLRALERGHRIAVVETRDHVGVSIDTPQDLARARALLERAARAGTHLGED